VLLIAVGVVVLVAAIGTAGVLVLFPPERVDVKVAGPSQVVALRPGTWTFQVRNLGPRVDDFGIQMSGGDGWVAQHSITSASGGCDAQAKGDTLLCGALEQSETKTISVAANPNAAGTYSYTATFCDCSQGRQMALLGPNSPRVTVPGSTPARYAETWSESVQPEPVAAVTVTDLNNNSLPGATVIVQGSSVAAVSATTGLARLGLGPLSPGIYTVVATDGGYINTGTQITVPDFGDATPVSLAMSWAPPIGTFVFHPHSTIYQVMVVTGGNPDYTLSGYIVEWHCYSLDWTTTAVTVTLGRDQLTWDGLDIPMRPGAISTSYVLNGRLPNTSKPAPAGTCVNGQNAW
jgi:hypothetical protein